MAHVETSEASRRVLKTCARRVALRASWKQLALPAQASSSLRKAIAAATASPQTPCLVLMAGASRTDRSRAAQVLARDTGLLLYRVDVASIISQYIGETEKQLDGLFTAASSENVILFFDEADALFGKRTGVKDAHDRYANIALHRALRRSKAHPGVVLFGANLKRNIDNAYTRRFHHIVRFPAAEQASRKVGR